MNSIQEPRLGAHERHLMRKIDHPELFGLEGRIPDERIREAQAEDRQEAAAFEEAFEVLLNQAIDLEPNTPSETVLALKDKVDLLYTRCAGLYGDQTQVREALGRLAAAIMRSVRAGAQGDAAALARLHEEDRARALHFELLRFPVVADLLREDRLIDPDELAATLLSESPDAAAAALQLFPREEQLRLCAEARDRLLALRSAGHELPDPWNRLRQLESLIETDAVDG